MSFIKTQHWNWNKDNGYKYGTNCCLVYNVALMSVYIM